MSDEDLYLEATDEIRNNQIDSAVWAKAIALCEGDDEKAKYMYVKLRVEGLANKTSPATLEKVQTSPADAREKTESKNKNNEITRPIEDAKTNLASTTEVGAISDTLESVSPEPPQSTPRDQIIELPLAGPWRRYFARIIDLWFLILPISFLVGYVGATASIEFALWIQKPGSEYIFGWLMIPLVLLLEGLIFGVFGTTLGKAILGVKVVTVAAYKVSMGQYMNRLLGVYWSGLGTGIPLVTLFTMAHQYGRLRKGKHAGYDEGQFNVKATKIGFFRILLAVAFIVGLVSFNAVLNVINKSSEQTYYSGSKWTNEVSGKMVSIPAGWIHEHHENEDGQPIEIFTSPNLGIFAIFAKEDVDPGLSLSDYANFWAVAAKGSMTLSVPGQSVTINGRPALHITGEIAGDKSQKIDAALLKNRKHMWRVVLMGTSGRNPAPKEAIQLRSILFNTIE